MSAELADSLLSTEDDRLSQAEAVVRAYCGWHIAPSRTETVTVEACGGTSLNLPSLYVTEVTAVTDNGTDVSLDDFAVRSYGVLDLYGGFWGYRTVEVAMTHGYPGVPPDVTAVVQRVAARAISDPGAAQQVGQVRFAVSLTQGAALGGTLSDYDRELLAPYRIPRRP